MDLPKRRYLLIPNLLIPMVDNTGYIVFDSIEKRDNYINIQKARMPNYDIKKMYLKAEQNYV